MKIVHRLLETVRPHLIDKQVVRFILILGAGLCIDYLLPLFPVCQLLVTPYEFLFCPLLIKIYVEETGLSFWEQAWSLRSLVIVVLAGVIVTLLEAIETKLRS